ncbi:hypothetical protein ACFLZM_05170 [Thermodesulfobacteriota bacterium]
MICYIVLWKFIILYSPLRCPQGMLLFLIVRLPRQIHDSGERSGFNWGPDQEKTKKILCDLRAWFI